jgi:hypothetical protein
MIEDMFVRRLCCLASFEFKVVGHLMESDSSTDELNIDVVVDPKLDDGCDLASAIRKCARMCSQSEEESEYGDMLLDLDEYESDTESYMSDSSISVMRPSECLPENVTIQLVKITETEETSKDFSTGECTASMTFISSDIYIRAEQ